MFNLKNTKKGFSLFTALVSLLLISISLILIFNMLKTEDTYLSMIEDQSSNSDLITVADLARADAFNSFVISLRVEWEEFRNNPDNSINLRREDVDLNWDAFVDKVANKYFFEQNFPEFFAEAIISKIKFTPDVIGYRVNLQTKVNQANPNQTPAQALGVVIKQAFNDAGNQVNVINCKQDSDTCTGSFYMKLSTTDLSESDFESLPTVTVIRLKNNEVIQRPVLSRGVYKIYMPWRGFQAMRVARRIAYSPEIEKSETPTESDSASNVGLFNPILHNTLEQARLGVCDPNSCAPRTSFFTTVKEDGYKKSCIEPYTIPNADVSTDGAADFPITNFINIKTPAVQYTLGTQNNTDITGLFNTMMLDTVKSNLDYRITNETILFTKSLKMTSTVNGIADYTGPVLVPSGKQIIINKIDSKVLDRTTKQITTTTATGGPGLNNINTETFNPSNINSISGGLGLFYNTTTKRGMNPFEIDNVNYKLSIFNPEPLSTSNLKCYELDSYITYDLIFKETNPKYIVGTGEPEMHIKLLDAYSGFTYPSLEQGSYSINPKGYIEPYPTEIIPNASASSQNQWMCKDYTGVINNGPECVKD